MGIRSLAVVGILASVLVSAHAFAQNDLFAGGYPLAEDTIDIGLTDEQLDAYKQFGAHVIYLAPTYENGKIDQLGLAEKIDMNTVILEGKILSFKTEGGFDVNIPYLTQTAAAMAKKQILEGRSIEIGNCLRDVVVDRTNYRDGAKGSSCHTEVVVETFSCKTMDSTPTVIYFTPESFKLVDMRLARSMMKAHDARERDVCLGFSPY